MKSPNSGLRPDLFLQLPFGSGGGVRLSGILSGYPRVPLLPPGADQQGEHSQSFMPSLAIVPVAAGALAAVAPSCRRRPRQRRRGPLLLLPPGVGGSLARVADPDDRCLPADPETSRAAATLRRNLCPGPLRPMTAGGRALRRALRGAAPPERFPLLHGYELLRLALASRDGSEGVRDEAETLLMGTYARFAECAGAPPRPPSSSASLFSEYAQHFGGAAAKALNATTSADFQLVAKAHVLGLAQTASLPRTTAGEARRLYSGACRFGHALRQAELRFQAAGAAGTFVPLTLEAEMLREELEELWKRSPPAEGGPAAVSSSLARRPLPGSVTEGDEEAARRSLQEALARLRRIGEARPGLATYLGWLGTYDPEALSLLAKPAPAVDLAMQLQVEAVWGPQERSDEAVEVAMTPSDLVEALLLGAWLRDAWADAEECMSRHRQDEDADSAP